MASPATRWLLAAALTLGLGVPALLQAQPAAEMSQGEADLKDLARTALPAVVLLRVYDAAGRAVGNGTGFFLEDGVLATNHHVVASAARLGAVLSDGREVPIEGVLAEDTVHDLALLAAPAVAQPLRLYSGPGVEPGEEVVVVGSPEGLSGSLSTGIVSAVRRKGLEGFSPGPLIQITAPISPGSSGSPVMNLRGEVLGVAVAVHRTGQNLNFAVPAELLRQLRERIDPSGAPVRTLGTLAVKEKVALGRNLAISVLVFTALIVVLRRLR